jgi:DNA-binding transcriptional ArsR family regulator
MATAILNTKKAGSKAARADNKAVLRKREIQRVASLLKHVSDPTRLQVISLLAERERHVGALCVELTQSQPALSHHLALLRLGGLIDRRRRGKNNIYSLTDAGERLSEIVKGMIR